MFLHHSLLQRVQDLDTFQKPKKLSGFSGGGEAWAGWEAALRFRCVFVSYFCIVCSGEYFEARGQFFEGGSCWRCRGGVLAQVRMLFGQLFEGFRKKKLTARKK